MPEGFTITPILIPLVALLLGWVIGFFDSNNRAAKKIKEAEAVAQAAQKEAERKIALAQQQIAQTSQSPMDDPGYLRLKNQNGSYILEMDGYAISGALTPDKKKRLIDLLTIIRPYLEGAIPPQPAAPQNFVSTPSAAASVQTPPAPAPIKQAYTPPPAPVVPVPASPFAVKPVIAKPEEAKPFASLSMVGQIDSILQEQLARSPLANRGIRLTESPEGGVEVYVGLQKFFTVDEVTDQIVKAAIRAAIAEWENKFTPGL